jgi:hypothetical protein
LRLEAEAKAGRLRLAKEKADAEEATRVEAERLRLE